MNMGHISVCAMLRVCHVICCGYIPKVYASLYVVALSSLVFPTVSEHQRPILPSMGPFPYVVPETDARAQSW